MFRNASIDGSETTKRVDGARRAGGNLTFCEAFGRSHAVLFSEPNIQTPGNAQTFSVAMPSRSFLTGT